ncbi:ABC transporter ATP-binding protein [Tessaracoccus sp. OH4464_COT-324]|uniref:ABC transporter ATP-binding protein n=1 Tax=Tessaracoccus sp. OH4464_COT-324 TaxID=2491059 RepID=UPI000F631563|nr:ABC transporter ATP-binding protein [Tessaracoccus sp. OH4464_COT-324]RRD46859.1 ABC transporter ATP-binding protein [Tessaracoccus sp. OH4464_COT-324]
MPLILDNVAFRYPGVEETVFANVSLTIDDGAAVALVGPSGVGKSTLLAVAGGLLAPSSGRVLLDDDAPRPHHVGWILQSTNLLPRRSVLDNVTLPAIIRGQRRQDAERAAVELLNAVGLPGFEQRPARKLSGGQAQRVGVARAFLARPRIILADEPTANLDARTARQVADSLLAIKRENVSLVVATHDLAVAELCDRIIPWEELAPCG